MNVKKKILAIDDVRDFPDADYIARTAKDGIRALREDGPWDLLHLDHDLASIGQAENSTVTTSSVGLRKILSTHQRNSIL